jgi:ankyrin repeat protein
MSLIKRQPRRCSDQLLDAINKNDVAAELGRDEIVALLLEAGADINVVDDEYRLNACHFAIVHNHFDVLKLLVERGANLGVGDFNSLLSIVARFQRNERIVVFLLDAGAPLDGLSPESLLSLVTSGAVFERLVARNVDFAKIRDRRGATLCHYVALVFENVADLRFLVNACGSDAVHAVDNARQTPLHWVVDQTAMVQLCEFWSSWVPT